MLSVTLRPHILIAYGPEFHVASYAINNGDRLAGNLASKYDREVKTWIGDHGPKLLQVWNLTQTGNDAQTLICELKGE